MINKKEKWQEIANRGLQDKFDPETRAKFDEAVRRGLITMPQNKEDLDPLAGLANDYGVAENLLSFASGIVAEPIAGISGIAQSINPFAEEGSGAKTALSVRDKLTFTPKSEEGKMQQKILGETLQPLGEAISNTEKYLGDNVFKLTGSPFLATVAATLPTAAMEIIGFKGAGRTTKAPKAPTKRAITSAVLESAPEIDALKKAARGVYKELDNSGVMIKKDSMQRLSDKVSKTARANGADIRLTPKASGIVDIIQDSAKNAENITELDILRKKARTVVKSIQPEEAMIAGAIIDDIDDFMDSIKGTDIAVNGSVKASEIGKKYGVARKLWGRAKRSEMITEAFEKGSNAAAGAEAGIRNEFNNLLKHQKKSKFLTASDKELMTSMIKGDFNQNFTRAVGKLGLSIDRSPNVIGAFIGGAGAGGMAAGFGGASLPVAVGAVGAGTVLKQVAKTLTTNKAKFVNAMTKAGTDGNKIAEAYLKIVPKAKRNVKDLANLLADPSINIEDLQMIANKTVQDAADIAKGKRYIQLASAATTASALNATKDDNDEKSQ